MPLPPIPEPLLAERLHATLKRNFQAMPGVQWLELLCKHIPDRNEHMVRHDGRYSSRTRGAEREPPELEASDTEVQSPARQAAKAAWAKLIRKVYEVDPLECPNRGAAICRRPVLFGRYALSSLRPAANRKIVHPQFTESLLH